MMKRLLQSSPTGPANFYLLNMFGMAYQSNNVCVHQVHGFGLLHKAQFPPNSLDCLVSPLP